MSLGVTVLGRYKMTCGHEILGANSLFGRDTERGVNLLSLNKELIGFSLTE